MVNLRHTQVTFCRKTKIRKRRTQHFDEYGKFLINIEDFAQPTMIMMFATKKRNKITRHLQRAIALAISR